MTKKTKYNTHAASFSYDGVILYCYDENKFSLNEFIYFENHGYINAIENKWQLFAKIPKNNSNFVKDFAYGLN